MRVVMVRDVMLNAAVAENVCFGFSTIFFLKTRLLVRLHIVYMTVCTHLGPYIQIVIHLMSYTCSDVAIVTFSMWAIHLENSTRGSKCMLLEFQILQKYSFCKILSSHFNEGACTNTDYFVQIIEKLEGTGKTYRGAMDLTVTPLRKAGEFYWILKLRTVFPYGLNDRVGDEYKNVNSDKQIGTKFKPLERNFDRIGRSKSKGSSMKLTPETFYLISITC